MTSFTPTTVQTPTYFPVFPPPSSSTITSSSTRADESTTGVEATSRTNDSASEITATQISKTISSTTNQLRNRKHDLSPDSAKRADEQKKAKKREYYVKSVEKEKARLRELSPDSAKKFVEEKRAKKRAKDQSRRSKEKAERVRGDVASEEVTHGRQKLELHVDPQQVEQEEVLIQASVSNPQSRAPSFMPHEPLAHPLVAVDQGAIPGLAARSDCDQNQFMESEKELGDHGSSALSTKITEPDGHHDIAAKTDALTTSRRYHDLIKELAGDDLPEQEEYFQLSHAFAWIATLSDRLKEAQSERDTARREAKTNFTNRMLAQRTLGIQSTPVAIAEVDETSASLKLQLLVANARCEDLASTNQDRTRYLEGCLDQANGKTDVIRQFLATTQNQCDDLQKALDIAQLELSAMTAERDAMAAKVASLESRVLEAESRVESTTSRELSGPDLGWPIDDAQHIAKALAALDRIKQLTSRVHDSNEPQNSASISLQAS